MAEVGALSTDVCLLGSSERDSRYMCRHRETWLSNRSPAAVGYTGWGARWKP